MKTKVLILAGIFLIGNLSIASADTKIEATRSVSGQGEVEIVENLGTITVRGWERNSIHVSGNLIEGIDELLITQEGNRTVIRVNHTQKRDLRDITLNIEIPSANDLTVNGGIANISVNGIKGTQTLRSISGWITTEIAGENIFIKGGTGKIKVTGTGHAAPLSLSTISGNIVVNNITGKLMVTSITGDVDINKAVISQAEMTTTNGHISLDGRLTEDGNITVKTINGDIEIKLDKPDNLAIEIDNLNGNSNNCLDTRIRPADAPPESRHHSYLNGDGSRKVLINTINGDVDICPNP